MTSRAGRADAADRLDYLRQVGALLWPPPASLDVVPRSDRMPPDERYLLVPGRGRPRLLVPAGSSRTAAAAVRDHGEPRSARARLRSLVLAGAVRSGLAGVVSGDRVRVRVPAGGETIESHLSEALGRRVRVSLHLSPARANRKPVLRLLDGRGRVAGYAKVGVDPLTCRLVRGEARTLEELGEAGLTRLRPPSVLHHGTWRGLEVLVLAPLPVSRRGPYDRELTAGAMVELARVRGTDTAVLGASDYWRDLDDRMAALPDGPQATATRTAAAALLGDVGGRSLAFGAWHGDWTPWNTARVGSTVLVWDWERFAAPAPLGFDALHDAAQAAVASGAGLDGVAEETVARAAGLLRPFGVPAADAGPTARLYLLDLAVRYVTDGQAAKGGRGGAVEEWLLPVVEGRRMPAERS
jgi:hypothetical protein